MLTLEWRQIAAWRPQYPDLEPFWHLQLFPDYRIQTRSCLPTLQREYWPVSLQWISLHLTPKPKSGQTQLWNSDRIELIGQLPQGQFLLLSQHSSLRTVFAIYLRCICQEPDKYS